jgi:hypothetical protein
MLFAEKIFEANFKISVGVSVGHVVTIGIIGAQELGGDEGQVNI